MKLVADQNKRKISGEQGKFHLNTNHDIICMLQHCTIHACARSKENMGVNSQHIQFKNKDQMIIANLTCTIGTCQGK